MARWSAGVRLHEAAAEPVVMGAITVTPLSQALTVGWSGGGLVWNRPTAVLVERDGRMRRVPIVDVTRVAQVTLVAVALLVVLAARAGAARSNVRKESRK